MAIQKISAVIIQGHGAASGLGNDPRYPNGTIALQLPHFKERGLDLSAFYRGTLNLDISPYNYELREPAYYLENIEWSKHIPPESFYFFNLLIYVDSITYDGLVYMPDPKTKVDHIQPSQMLEVIAPSIPGVYYGREIDIEVDDSSLLLKG